MRTSIDGASVPRLTWSRIVLLALPLITALLLIASPAPAKAAPAEVVDGEATWGLYDPLRAAFGTGYRTFDSNGYVWQKGSTYPSDPFGFTVVGGEYEEDENVLIETDDSGWVELGYRLGTGGSGFIGSTVVGIWIRVGGLVIDFDDDTGVGTLSGNTQSGFHGCPFVSPAFREFADLNADTVYHATNNPDPAVKTVNLDGSITWSNVKVELTDPNLGLGAPNCTINPSGFPAGTQLDPIEFTIEVAP